MLNLLTKIRKQHYVILTLFSLIYFCTTMCTTQHHLSAGPGILDGDGKAFAGSASCESCHKNIYRTHIHTAHYRDSKPASREYIKGSFDSTRNHFVYNKFSEVVLEHKNGAFFQTAYLNGEEYQSEPFDIVIGSGRKGQTYLYWGDNGKLFQLPVSYYTPLDSWCNSPGYPTNFVRFNRQIPAHCIECHGTYARVEDRSNTGNGDYFDKSQIIFGVDCEKCHGPAAAHVAYHQAHPGESTGKYILNAKNLPRQRRLDACALCHSGIRDERQPAFSFKVGDTLDNYSVPAYNMDSSATLDVHGNQYGLLTSSQCYKQSQMDCSSCHDPHVNEFNSPKLFSQRCMVCHTEAAHNTCTMPATPGLVLGDNCVDCHMPNLPSQKIFLMLSNGSKTTPDLVRTHRVAIYAASTKEYLEKLKARKAPRS